MTKYPVLPIILPNNLKDVKNGNLDVSLLRDVGYPTGKMHSLAATAWNAMQLDAFFNGIELKQVGTYRSLTKQEVMFSDRYQLTPTDRVPVVKRTYKGKTWYLKKGKAPSAAPGTSNHGLGLAIDVADASGKRLEWLLGDGFTTSNALKYGFSWEVESGPNAEAWHIRYVCGDKLPQAVLDAIEAFPSLDVR
mgnify:CR=1 FL=1